MAKQTKDKYFAVLFFCSVFLMGVVGSTAFAKYTSTFTGTGSIKIAAFYLDANAMAGADATDNVFESNIALEDLVPGSSKSIPITITNFETLDDDSVASDVALSYTISVIASDGLPLEYTLAPADETSTEQYAGALGEQVEGTGTASENLAASLAENDATARFYTYTTSSEGWFTAGSAQTHAYTLTVSWPDSATDASYMDASSSLAICLDAVQIEPTTE